MFMLATRCKERNALEEPLVSSVTATGIVTTAHFSGFIDTLFSSVPYQFAGPQTVVTTTAGQ